MSSVFNAIFDSMMASRGWPRDRAVINVTYKDAHAKFKPQVGAGNYARWMASGIPTSLWSQAEADAFEEQGAEAEAEAAADGGLEEQYAAERKLVAGLRASANKLSREIGRLEHLVHRLKSPEGAKGVVADYLGGLLGAASAIGTGVKDAKDEVEKYTKPVTDTGGWLTDQAVDAASQKPSGPTAQEKWTKLTTNLETADQLMTGELHLIWKQTRPSYKSFRAARAQFDAASQAWVDAGNDVEAGMAVGGMRDGMKAMAAAARTFGSVCARHDVVTKAGNLAALGKAIDEGIGLAVSTAVDALASSLTGEVDKAAKDSLKEQVRPSLEKATEVAYDKIKGAPKKAVEIAIQ